MHRKAWFDCIRAAMFSLSITALTGCQKSAETMKENTLQEDAVSEELVIEDKQDCPLNELFDYLNEEGEGIPYAYARIFITVNEADEEAEKSFEDSFYEFRQNVVNMEGTADISWQTFQTAGEFQEYFSMQENILSKEEGTYAIEFSYYQYQLAEDTHAIDIDRFLKERYDEADNPLCALSIDGKDMERRGPHSYCFSQSDEREIVVMDNVIYGLECRGIAEEIKEDDIGVLLRAYSAQKQNVEFYSGWVMDEEAMYWIDHDERVISLEDPTRVFTEVKGIDSTWEGRIYMENFALLKEADYQIRIYEEGPVLELHFAFAEEIPTSGYETYLFNGFCMDEDYEMTVTNLDTNEQLQSQKIQLCIEMPDMITFVDLDADGYLDMQIGKPTHWNGVRAEMDEFAGYAFMLWNPEESIFESKSEGEIEQSLIQNQEGTQGQDETEFMEYVVQSGDTLWGISRRFYGTGTRYTEIEERNAEVLSGYEYLMPGMVLRISEKGI